MKKLLYKLLLVLCFGILLTGCSISQKPRTLEKSMEIPSDGIISEDILEALKTDNKVITFEGESKGVKYEWTVFGSKIGEAKPVNLSIEVISESDSSIAFRTLGEEELEFAPLLSLYVSNVWDEENAVVCQKRENILTRVSEASITGSRQTVLNFQVTAPGTYFVFGEKLEEEAEDNETEAYSEAVAIETQSPKPSVQVAMAEVEPDPYTTAPSESGGAVIYGGKSVASNSEANKSEHVKEGSYDDDEKAPSKREVSDGKQEGKDEYLTDPVPVGKPMPVEPENQKINSEKTLNCTFSIECSTIFNNLDDLTEGKLDVLPSDGVIFAKTKVSFKEGESVYDVLQRICKENGIQMEASWTPIYNSAYVEGICNLYEFDCGTGSGWMYRVNGWYPNYGCSRYQLADGEVVEWRYTCDLGEDVGGGYAVNP